MKFRTSIFLAVLAILAIGCRPAPETAPEPDTSTSAETPAGPPRGPGAATSADGVEIAYTVHGAGEPALVFLHGWSCDQSYWSEQVDAFAGDHTVVTVDLAGHGASGTNRTDWYLASFGDDVRAVADALELGPMILVGHSMGGPAALEAARKMPERIVGIIGVDTFHDADMEIDRELWDRNMAAYDADFAGTCESFVRGMFRGDADAALVDRTVADMCASPPEIAKALLRRFGDYSFAAPMSFVDAPIRAINATLWPTSAENNRRYAPEFEVTLMEGVGHFLMLERPEEFNALLRQTVDDLESRLVVMEQVER